MSEKLKEEDALLIIDVQNDFCSGGALPVPEGDEVIPVLNGWIRRASEAGIPIFASRDWHPRGHISFKERGGLWPPHCVQGTEGAAFHPDLELDGIVKVISTAYTADAEAYSAFDGTELAGLLRDAGVSRIWVGGLATEYCVKETVLDALKSGFEVKLIMPAIRAIDVEPGDGQRALDEMKNAGAELVRGDA